MEHGAAVIINEVIIKHMHVDDYKCKFERSIIPEQVNVLHTTTSTLAQASPSFPHFLYGNINAHSFTSFIQYQPFESLHFVLFGIHPNQLFYSDMFASIISSRWEWEWDHVKLCSSVK